ncbi:MAG: hypothetical protein AB7S98_14520, partial [Burkholderiaceae bacterium]
MLERVRRTAELFAQEAKQRPRVMAIGLHPHLIGVPHRFETFRRMLDLLMATPGVCFMQGGQIADWYMSQMPRPPAAV